MCCRSFGIRIFMSFETLGLAPSILSAVLKAGFNEPTAVQAASIPRALAGNDLMVSAQTGSGKTAAFMLPALNRIAGMPANKGSGVQVLVLTPTRELAMQVAEATKLYGAHIPDLRIATVVGGMPYGAQLKALSRRVDVLVATPGRLIDHLQAKRVNLSTVHTLVLDEADRMLDMGFIEDIETIVARTPESRQTLLFSATLDGTIARLGAEMMRDPQQIQLTTQTARHDNITQSLLYADDASHKMQLLDHLLRDSSLDQAIVFTSTKRGADDLADRLSEQGFAAAALHGDMNQRQRTRTLGLLQKGRVRILVATDVAARGIDVQGISHAVNYDLPMQAEDYVHRIGRTGRAGRNGLAFTLATHSERHKVRRIEHFIGRAIPPSTIAGLEPKKTARPTYTDRKGKGGGNGKRFGGNGPRGGAGFSGKPRFDNNEGGRFGKAPGEGFGGKRSDDSFGGGGFRHDAKRFNEGGQGAGRSFSGPRGSFDKPARAEGFVRAERPAFSRDGAGDRPALGARARTGDRGARPSFGDRPERSGRSERSEYAPRSAAGKPGGRPSTRKTFGAKAAGPRSDARRPAFRT
jgi:superfamily II DNA/RNA helicase